ncbi:hypothetical protein BC830DRAFT_1085308 [Chytriomyces sp. MP71]|nr:hypothetical protein BC830DRAFT_1085308 [Chytriomyces sp. MP71]
MFGKAREGEETAGVDNEQNVSRKSGVFATACELLWVLPAYVREGRRIGVFFSWWLSISIKFQTFFSSHNKNYCERFILVVNIDNDLVSIIPSEEAVFVLGFEGGVTNDATVVSDPAAAGETKAIAHMLDADSFTPVAALWR